MTACRGIRGATTADANNKESILSATHEPGRTDAGLTCVSEMDAPTAVAVPRVIRVHLPVNTGVPADRPDLRARGVEA